MVKCPRCEQMVDETVRTTCPLCFTPIAGAQSEPSLSPEETQPAQAGVAPVQLGGSQPPPALRPGSQTAGGRVSLMGEIIPDDASAPQSFTGSNVAQMKDPRASLDEQNFEEAESANRRKNLFSYFMFFVVVFGGGGYYYWYNHRTNPQDQVKKYFEATKKLDYKTIYQLTAFTDEEKKSLPDESAFADQIKSAFAIVGGETQFRKLLASMSVGSVSAPKTDDKGVTKVKVTLNFAFGGKSFPVESDIEVKNEGGFWKVAAKPAELVKIGGN